MFNPDITEEMQGPYHHMFLTFSNKYCRSNRESVGTMFSKIDTQRLGSATKAVRLHDSI
jgi:hypothetical protein